MRILLVLVVVTTFPPHILLLSPREQDHALSRKTSISLSYRQDIDSPSSSSTDSDPRKSKAISSLCPDDTLYIKPISHLRIRQDAAHRRDCELQVQVSQRFGRTG